MQSIQLYERSADLSDQHLYDVVLCEGRVISSHLLLSQCSPFWRGVFGAPNLFLLDLSTVPEPVIELYMRQVNTLACGRRDAKQFVKVLEQYSTTLLYPHFDEYLKFVTFLLDDHALCILWTFLEKKALQSERAMYEQFPFIWTLVECLFDVYTHSRVLLETIIRFLMVHARTQLSDNHRRFISEQSNTLIDCSFVDYVDWMCLNNTPKAIYTHTHIARSDITLFVDALNVAQKPKLKSEEAKRLRALLAKPEYAAIRSHIQELVFIALMTALAFEKSEALMLYEQFNFITISQQQ